ncbi:hypothetical protein Dimus_015053 [Dionaea muscipula]
MGFKMRRTTFITNRFNEKPPFLSKTLLSCALYVVLPIVIFRLCFYLSQSPIPQTPAAQFTPNSPVLVTPAATIDSAMALASPKAAEDGGGIGKLINESSCDYSEGKWVRSELGPLYNDTSCGSSTIKEGRNCMNHGRPDLGYLSWRWKPRQCQLPRFDPQTFLTVMRNKHLAFVGDSMARNQLESLVCMLASSSPPRLVYSSGGEDDNKFRRWNFPSHNVTVSVYWSPFLVKGVEKTEEEKHNKLYMESVDEKWASDLGLFDMVVVSIGHWYLLPAVYFEGDLVLGCHYCPTLNHTEIGFYGMFSKAFRTALKAIVQRRSAANNIGNGIDVIVTTFSPHHFEGEWDKAGACPKTEPFDIDQLEAAGSSKKRLAGLGAMDEQMRKAQVEAVEEVKSMAAAGIVRIMTLDVTELAWLRPDGHPGPYMHPFPFADGVRDRVQNDCVHWCLPGPIDTWNEIMLQMIIKPRDYGN